MLKETVGTSGNIHGGMVAWWHGSSICAHILVSRTYLFVDSPNGKGRTL